MTTWCAAIVFNNNSDGTRIAVLPHSFFCNCFCHYALYGFRLGETKHKTTISLRIKQRLSLSNQLSENNGFICCQHEVILVKN